MVHFYDEKTGVYSMNLMADSESLFLYNNILTQQTLFIDRINNFQINKRVLASGVLNQVKSLKNYVLSELKSHYKIQSL